MNRSISFTMGEAVALASTLQSVKNAAAAELRGLGGPKRTPERTAFLRDTVAACDKILAVYDLASAVDTTRRHDA